MKKIAPSFLSADIWQVAAQLSALEEAGCEYLHLDIMDGHFVPNISFGPHYIQGLRKHSKMIFDTHLMVEEPDFLLEDFVKAGADIITVHVEAIKHLHRTIERIKSYGLKAGVSLNPATPLSALEEILPLVDLVLIMSVNPGFGGQSFIPEVINKIERLAALKKANNYQFIIEVDGGAKQDNIAQIAAAGAELIVAGSAVFGKENPAQAYQDLAAALA